MGEATDWARDALNGKRLNFIPIRGDSVSKVYGG